MKYSEERIHNRIQFLKSMIAQFENELETLDWVLSLMEEDEAKEAPETNEVEEDDNLILDDDEEDDIVQLAIAELFEEDVTDEVEAWDDDFDIVDDIDLLLEDEEAIEEMDAKLNEDLEQLEKEIETELGINDIGNLSKNIIKRNKEGAQYFD